MVNTKEDKLMALLRKRAINVSNEVLDKILDTMKDAWQLGHDEGHKQAYDKHTIRSNY